MSVPSSSATKLDLSPYMNTPAPENAKILSQNIHENHYTYSLDYTVLIAIIIVCITVITITLLKKGSR
ncbi:hypothetical protein SAMN05443246_5969 [Paenibacillus sp. GP183]|nr:hypothetical protein SAMN05443246_5969 [Paenibacillus sp. GP183]